MQKIFENFRKYLQEQEENDNKICLSIIKHEERTMFFLYSANLFLDQIKDEIKRENKIDDKLLRTIAAYSSLGMIDISKTKSSCMGSYAVKFSVIPKQYQGKGYAKRLYGLAQAYIYPHGLTSDRVSVSDQARMVWRSMDKKYPESDKLPPNKKPYIGQFDDQEDPKTEPKDDDCMIHQDKSLNKSYKNDDYKKSLKQYIRNSNKFVLYLAKKFKIDVSDMENNFRKAGSIVFSKNYYF